jgi:hypothetical protein
VILAEKHEEKLSILLSEEEKLKTGITPVLQDMELGKRNETSSFSSCC